MRRISGNGLVPDALIGSPHFVGAVALSAAATVILATLFSLPLSTTPAMTGALVRAGLVQAHAGVKLGILGAAFLVPHLVSPLAAMILIMVL